MAKHEAPGRHVKAAGEPKAPRPKNKKFRRAAAIVLICALLLTGAGAGGYYYLQHRSSKTVNVFPLAQLGTTDTWYDRVQTGGQVRADRMQSIYLSSTQTVTDVFVQEGQQIKKGDPILAFDTTLDEVELTRKQIAIEQLKLDLQEAQKDLEEIDTYKVGSPVYPAPKPTAEPARPEPTTVPLFQHGTGTAEDPFVFLWNDELYLSDAAVEELLLLTQPSPTPEPSPSATPEPEQTGGEPENGEEAAAAASADPVGGPVPMDAAHTLTVRPLFAPVRSLRDPEQTDAPEPTDTPVPTESSAPTESPEPVEPAEPTASAPEASGTPEPVEDRFRDMTAQDILHMFQNLETDEEKQALYASLTDQEKQSIAAVMTQEELDQLTSLLGDAGVVDPSFPPSSIKPDPQGPDDGGADQDSPTPSGEQPEPAPSEGPSPSAEPSPTPTAGPTGAGYYMVFEIRDNNSMQGDILRAFEVQFVLSGFGWEKYWSYRVVETAYEPQIVPVPTPDDDAGFFDPGIYYPAAEIARMRAEAQRRITSMNLQLKKAEQELKQVEFELSNGEVLCTTDGVVKTVLDPDEAREQDKPVVLVSGGGGYYITAYMSEFDMDRMHVGDTVTVNNYMSGEELDASITEISQYPTDNDHSDYYSQSGNGNASKYPFTVEVGEDANLREGNYVSVYFSASGKAPAKDEDESGSFYLENAFIRTEGGRSYVYAAGPDGLLEKRYVTTGGSMYGMLTEITGGLDMETDYIAFPYGRSVKAGAKTEIQENISVLYGY